MTDRILEAIARYRLFEPGQRVVAGVSGGPDSTALLHALWSVKSTLGIDLIAAHLNHGFRGAEAEGDAAYVADLCVRLGVPLETAFVDVPALRKRLRISAQEAAREARHAFLRRVAAEAGAERLALAHTSDDRVETILLNIIRGCGIDGLGGFPALEPPIARPLYDLTRADVEAYCASQGLEPRRDSSNNDLKYRRNRVRAELLPNLRTYYNPRVQEAILRLADIASADNEALEALVDDAFSKVVSPGAGYAEIDRNALRAQPLALRRRLLRAGLLHVRGDLADVGLESLDRILDRITAESRAGGLWRESETGLELELHGGRVTVRLQGTGADPEPWRIDLAGGGIVDLPDGWRAACRAATDTDALVWLEEVSAQGGAVEVAAFRTEDARMPLAARSWRPGDRMRPMGCGGSRKLQDLFVDRKVPRTQRARVPVVTDADGRILIVGSLAVDERAVVRTAGHRFQAPAEELVWIVLLGPVRGAGSAG